jgi:ElaB/YqjD/DUF883 family membrane-anchored ribosome-binding protein
MTIEQDRTTSSGTSGKTGETSLRERVGETYGSARERAVDAYDSARERASLASAKAGDQIDQAPLIALAGGLAAGALLAALLPRTNRENELLGPVGGKITGSARAAVDAAKDAGREKLNELNLTRDAGTSALQTILRGVSEAASDAVRRKD